MKANTELALAILSGLCGLLTAVFVLAGYDKLAAFTGGIGLFLCNVVWVMRLT